ncbi:MAG: hypothetical protein P1P90_01385 [Patescibacteria group bacterium]|nr:hypothetical protein [Patescibacteria group bacterium]
MKNNFTFGVALVAVMSVVLFGAGCNPFQSAQDKFEEKAAEKMTEKLLESMGGGDVDIDINGEGDDATITFNDEEGGGQMMFGENVELPSDLTESIIVYSNAKLVGVIRDVGEKDSAMITLTTQDQTKEVADWYRNEYEKAGWEKTQTVTIEDAEMLGYERADEQVFITITTDDDERMISINWSF